MKRAILTVATASLLGCGLANAADLAVRTRPLQPVVLGWTGWYAGLNAGATWSGDNSVEIASAPTFNAPGLNAAILNQGAAGATATLSNGSGRGSMFGGQVGYSWQFANTVYAVEADIQRGPSTIHYTGDTAVPTNNGFPMMTHLNASKQLAYLGTARGRFGWLAIPTLLLYGTAGLAYGGVRSDIGISQFHANSNTFGSTGVSFSESRAGYTLGGGAEWLFAPQWSVKLEYLYYDLGSASYAAPLLAAYFTNGFLRYGVSPLVSTRFEGHIARVGVNYRL